MIRWTLTYKPSMVQYLISLREAGTDVRKAVKALQGGIPKDSRRIQNAPETWEWLEARHWITFVVAREKKSISVSDVSEIGL